MRPPEQRRCPLVGLRADKAAEQKKLNGQLHENGHFFTHLCWLAWLPVWWVQTGVTAVDKTFDCNSAHATMLEA